MAPPPTRSLTDSLSPLVARIAADLRAKILAPSAANERARQLHRDERVGDDFAVWTDLLSRRAAVLWVLRSVYVRVLEDRGLLRPQRILDRESQDLFARLAPNLGETAYLRWVWRDLGATEGGLPELFAPQPAEVALPSDELSRALLDFWRSQDPDTGAVRWLFTEEHFDGRLMGDLYQDLDPVVKARFALCQTPGFILDFILDETLTPAIAEWGVETVRVIDPACGSGHFLLAAFKRLFDGMCAKFPERPVRDVVGDVLSRVVGIDLNDYACALARARLVMTALERCGETDLAAASGFHPQVYWADALEQVERDEWTQLGLGLDGGSREKPRAMLTRPEVRTALRPLLNAGFHVVVGNPPYITEKDPKQKAYHREKIGKNRRYVSAERQYSLGAPFTERMFQLALVGGYVGEITSNSFMKREFGKALIERVLARVDLRKVVDAAGMILPSHGTPTVLLFGRNQRPSSDTVRVVMGKRGDLGRNVDPENGRVWAGITAGHEKAGFETDYISVVDVARRTMDKHEWSIGGGGAAELKLALDQHSSLQNACRGVDIGFGAVTREDDAYVVGIRAALRLGAPSVGIRPMIEGEHVRNWATLPALGAIWPHWGSNDQAEDQRFIRTIERVLWPVRVILKERVAYGETQLERGLAWHEYSMLFAHRYRNPLRLTLAVVSSQVHAALDRGGACHKDVVLLINLAPGTSEACHLVVLAQLNSSVACFWMKQVCQNKGVRGEGGGLTSANWEQFYQFGGTKLQSFPLASTDDTTLEAFAHRLDALARGRVADSARAMLDAHASGGAAVLRALLDARRQRDLDALFAMVGLQEELDWYCYRLYGIDTEVVTRAPDDVPPLRPGLRAFEVTLAERDAESRAALARREEPDEAPTAWFERHGWEPHTTLDVLPATERTIVEDRLARTAASRELGLVEQPTYKRRWYKPDHATEERDALRTWLADRIEDHVKARRETWTVPQVAVALGSDPSVRAVAEVLEARSDYDLEALIEERVRSESVPNNKHHVFKPDGLIKRAAWEETWALQHREDAGEKVSPPVPPKYGSGDYLRAEHWSQRGKLDVPKERFIAFTEIPGDGPTRYGWAGWTPRERAKVLVEVDEALESDGVAKDDRLGVLYGVWFLLPWVAWESKSAAEEFAAIVREQVGPDGVTDAMLAEWAAKHPPGRGSKVSRKRK